jgi:hypothetical protein
MQLNNERFLIGFEFSINNSKHAMLYENKKAVMIGYSNIDGLG